MNTRQFKETFLEYARTGVPPTIYISAVSRFVRGYHHITQEKFLQYRKEFIEECNSDTTINHCHAYLPDNFNNDFLTLCSEIQKEDREIKFENVIIEGLFILDKFVNDYAEMLFDSKKTVASINAENKKRIQLQVYAAATHYTDFSKTVEENVEFIKRKYLSYYRSEYDDYLRITIRDLFIFKKLSLIDQTEKEDLIKKGVIQSLKLSHHDLLFGNSN